MVQLKSLNLNKEQFDKLSQSLRLSDFVKFAKYIPSADDDKNCFDEIKNAIIAIEKTEAKPPFRGWGFMLYNYIKNMDFAYPIVFGLFALLPLLIWWYVKKYSRKQATIKVSTAHAFTVSSWKNRFRHLPFILRLLALSCLILALARPQKRNNEQRTEGEGIDIVFCMDVSGSMGSRDIPPSRMDVAKEVAEEFVRSRPVDRIGLVIFSGESFTQCPITNDRNTLITQIQTLESRRYLKDGTVIGEGLATAVDRLLKAMLKVK